MLHIRIPKEKCTAKRNGERHPTIITYRRVAIRQAFTVEAVKAKK